jgi:hypothetical protein
VTCTFVSCIQMKTEVHKKICGVTKIFFLCNYSSKIVSKTQLWFIGRNESKLNERTDAQAYKGRRNFIPRILNINARRRLFYIFIFLKFIPQRKKPLFLYTIALGGGGWRAPQQMLRTHRSLEAYCATLWWRWLVFQFFRVMEHSGMKLTGENRSTRGKTCPSAILFTTILTWTEPGFFLLILSYHFIFIIKIIKTTKTSQFH